MDISNSSAGGAAVACPVCTLYLREGISLQRHLDTHPKEQVIEALIKASVGPVQSQQQHQAQLSPVPLSSPTVHSAASTPQLPHSAQLSTQSPYPIGPVFECPPIGTVMPPQFASFSYQQFVNNGTVMIPQYAMAPQSNQMMQMLYNPYGIYQQQQIPTVQMISPVTTIGGASGKVRTGSNLLSENSHPTASITVPVNSNEPKQILPEILPELEVDTDHVLPDVNGISPTASSSLHQTSRHLNDEGENMQAEQQPSQESRPTIEKFFAIERDYHPASKSLSINCDISNRTATPLIDHSRDVISIDNDNRTDGNDNEDDAGVEEDADDGDNDDGENNDIENHTRDENAQNRENDEVRAVTGTAQTVPLDVGDIKPVSISQLPDIHCKIIRQESSTPEDYLSIHKECSEQVVVSENSRNLSDFEIQEIKESDAKSFGNEKSLGTGVNSSKSHVSPTAKESIQPEAEQLEHLLIKIMQSELSCTSEKDHPDDQVDSNDKRWVKGISTVGTEGTDKPSTRTITKGNSCIETIEDEIEFKDCHSPYRYKHSLSAPASPYTQKKSYHTYSVRSEIGSLENLNSYPVGFHARILHNEHEDDDIDQQVQMEEDEEDDDENGEEEVAAVEEDGDEVEDEEEDEDEDEDDDEDEEDDEDEDGDEDEESDDIIGIDIAPIVNDKLQVEEDNFDDADMEIAEIVSPHTPTIKCAESMDYGRSHTPLSASSGISVLRVRKDLSKPCSPASVHSFCNVDRNDMNSDEMIEIALSNASEDVSDDKKDESDYLGGEEASSKQNVFQDQVSPSQNIDKKFVSHVAYQQQSVITENINTFSALHSQQTTTTTTTTTALLNDSYPVGSSKIQNSLNLSDSLEGPDTDGGMETKSFHYTKTVVQKQSLELLNLNEDAHAGPMNVFEFDGLQILVPSAFINESSQKAVSATSQQSMPSSEGGVGIDEEVKSINMRADETMPARGELSEQESNGYTEQSAWQLYMGQESSRMSTSYDLMARESWEESEGSENEMNGPLLDSKSLATHFTSSLFLDRDRKTPTKRTFKCYHCSEVFDCPKERRVHSATVHKEAGPSSSSSREQVDQVEVKDIKLLDGRMNIFEDIFVPGLHVQQIYHHQQPLLHQLQPAQSSELNKLESEHKIDSLVVQSSVETTCTLCNQRFSSEVSLQLHQRRMHVTEKSKRVRESAKCQICNEMFPSVLLFNAHLKVHPLECSQCGKYFYRKQNFKLHMKRHLGIKPFPCTVCDKAFLTKQKLDEHTNGHTGNAPVKCNLCNETFRRYSNLTQHKNRHHLNIKKKLKDYICHCGEVFHTKKKLAWHKEIHDEKPKACTYCNERFIHMASLTRHMRRAHNRRFVPDAQRESENVECPICKCIYLRSSLAVHMRVHNGERPYECQVCSKAFSTKWNLQLHKWTHAARSAKPFKCNQCSAAFYRHSDYTAHMNSHRNVRPYTCNYCGAQFIRKYNCLRHVKEHEENKAYTCDVCNKTFHRSYYLKEHLRVHSGARPYTCHICGKSSGTKSNHNKHVRIHHAREPVNTEN